MGEMSGESWCWIAASSAQLAVGVAAYRRGSGDGTIAATAMPFKAFAIATLFVGAGATAAAGCLHASGIRTARECCVLRQVDDMKAVGSRIRRWMLRLASNHD